MAKFVYGTLEPNEWNRSSVAVTLYFDGVPTAEEVKQACEKDFVGPLSPIEPSSYDECPTPLSKKKGLVRIQTPAG